MAAKVGSGDGPEKLTLQVLLGVGVGAQEPKRDEGPMQKALTKSL